MKLTTPIKVTVDLRLSEVEVQKVKCEPGELLIFQCPKDTSEPHQIREYQRAIGHLLYEAGYGSWKYLCVPHGMEVSKAQGDSPSWRQCQQFIPGTSQQVGEVNR